MKRGLRSTISKTIGPAITIVFAGVSAFLFLPSIQTGAVAVEPSRPAAETAVETGAKYSKYSHDVPAHKNKKCSDCHKFPSANWNKVRPEADAFPDITDYPKHDSCVSCHRRQFFSGPKPAICTICHVNPSPKDSRRYPFPNPAEAFNKTERGQTSFSEFAVGFPHEIHISMLASTHNVPSNSDPKGTAFIKAGFRKPFKSDTCAMCHQLVMPQGDSDDEYVTTPPKDLGDSFWLKKGTFMSKPPGHTQCFTCHSADSGLSPAPTDCGTCHKLQPKDLKTDYDPKAAKQMGIDEKILMASWRRRTSSATFRHEWLPHADMDCDACHTVAKLAPADPKVKAVSITACSNCHITATTDDGGILNYEIDSRKKDAKFECVKCHLAYKSLPIPASHPKAIKALGEN